MKISRIKIELQNPLDAGWLLNFCNKEKLYCQIENQPVKNTNEPLVCNVFITLNMDNILYILNSFMRSEDIAKIELAIVIQKQVIIILNEGE